MPSVVWSRAALVDLDNQYQFLKINSPETAAHALQAIVNAGKSLAQTPQRGTPVADTPGLRKLQVRFGKFGYVIRYAIVEREVLILRVYHGRQSRPS